MWQAFALLPCARVFWCLLVGASVVVRLLDSSVDSSLCFGHSFCGVSPFLILCLCGIYGFLSDEFALWVESVPACYGSALLGVHLFTFSWVLGHLFIPRHPVSYAIGVFFLSLFAWKIFVSSGDFCLVWISGSRRDLVSLWGESGFIGVLCLAQFSGFPSRGGLPLGSVSVSVTPRTRSHLRFP